MKDVKDLVNQFNDDKSLLIETENLALKETISKLLEEVDRLRGMTTPKIIKLNISAEEEAVVTQIERLNVTSRIRNLSGEEVKMLDILIKNKRLLNEESTLNADFKQLPSGMTEEDALLLAESNADDIDTKDKEDRS